MSRSNGPATQPGAWPQQRPAPQQQPQQTTYEQDLAAWNAAQSQGRWPPQQPAQAAPPQGYAPPQHGGYAPQQAPEPRTQPPAYHYPPGAEGHDPYSRPTLGGRETTGSPAAHAAAYAPQFDPYTPPQQHPSAYGAQPAYAPAQPAYAPAPSYAPPLSQELSSLQRAPAPLAEPPHHPAPDLRGPHYDQSYDAWQQPAAQPAPDPRGYDFGGYQPHAAAELGAPRQPPQMSLEPSHSEWGAADGHYDPYTQHQGYQQPQHPAGPHDGQPRGNELEPAFQHDEHEDAGDYDIEEPKSGRRWGLIAASLIGAIAVGAGLTYGYKSVIGPDKAVATPVVKNTATPAKVKPAEPGGKQFAHTDSKIMGRLNDQSAAAASPSAADTDASGARKVQTVVVGRDGSIVATAPAPEPTRTAAAAPAVNVPGMTIVDGFGGKPPAAALAGAPAPGPVAAAPAQPARPVVVTPPATPAAPARPTVLAKAPPAVAVEAEAPIAAAPKAAPPKVAVPKKAAVTAAAGPAAAPASTGGNGFVAVLASVPASQKSSMDALKQFADMQQKFGAALANKTPEVREANLGDKGTYHRLLVGPPGSREQAGQLCSQLKAQGYGSCWVTAY